MAYPFGAKKLVLLKPFRAVLDFVDGAVKLITSPFAFVALNKANAVLTSHSGFRFGHRIPFS